MGRKNVQTDKHTPDLSELLRMDLQVVESPSHGYHHLAAVAGGYANVLALRFLPFTD